MAVKVFGHVLGVPVRAAFDGRKELAAAGVHPPLMAGIHGTKTDGADSIVVSGGYVDDEDLDDVVIYTGAGGNDPQTKRQIADQSIEQPGNAGMITSELAGYPVRVTRGAHAGSPYAPASGFRYDGLYAVVEHWLGTGDDGYKIVQFRLEKLPDSHPQSGPTSEGDAASYATTTVTRRIRDSRESRLVKALHENVCQVCGAEIEIDGDRMYAEGAHIRPLAKPHEGPDNTGNILCLCPNHHAQFDYGGLIIDVDLRVSNRITGVPIGNLRTHPKHQIDLGHLAYRLTIFPTGGSAP
jgi:putative restriction endonuclease